MATSQERLLQKKILAFLKKQQLPLFYWKCADQNRSGLPDIVMCVKGRFWGVELKSPGKVPTKLQILTLNEIDAAGGRGAWCSDWNGWEQIWLEAAA